MKEKVLIVEDQFIEAKSLQYVLENAGYNVCGTAGSVPKALELLEKHQPDIVLLDIILKGTLTGIDLGKKLREINIPFIYLSANADAKTLEDVKATRPYGFLVKPVRHRDVLVMLDIAKHIHQHGAEALIAQKTKQKASSTKPSDSYESLVGIGIIGSSRALQEVIKLSQIAGPVDTSVLLLGENGTGKERIAQHIYELSSRSDKPFIKVNCAALPASLIESILFGHERGAFTGATDKRIGKFEEANEGTIFLDEIGELTLDMQSRFLRVLQEREIERVGSNKPIKLNVRVIAATNKNLEREVAEGRFRMDLYFRLNVFPITIPPLRDRSEDIPGLVTHFIQLYSSKYQKNVKDISSQKIAELITYNWPGNIRELEHLIERSVLLCYGEVINQLPEFRLGKSLKTSQSTEVGKVKTMEEMEHDYILEVLERCNGKVAGTEGAAKTLGIKVSTLNSRIKKLGIEKEKIKYKSGED